MSRHALTCWCSIIRGCRAPRRHLTDFAIRQRGSAPIMSSTRVVKSGGSYPRGGARFTPACRAGRANASQFSVDRRRDRQPRPRMGLPPISQCADDGSRISLSRYPVPASDPAASRCRSLGHCPRPQDRSGRTLRLAASRPCGHRDLAGTDRTAAGRGARPRASRRRPERNRLLRQPGYREGGRSRLPAALSPQPRRRASSMARPRPAWPKCGRLSRARAESPEGGALESARPHFS